MIQSKAHYNCLLCLFLLLPSVLLGQSVSSSSKKAIALYAEARNCDSDSMAVALAKQAVTIDPTFTEAYWFMATRYGNMRCVDCQITTLREAVKRTTMRIDESRYRLAKALYANGEYEASEEVLSSIAPSYATAKVAALHERNSYALELKQHPVDFRPHNLEFINTPYDDYWPALTLDGSVLSTTVLIADKRRPSLEWNEEIYWSFRDEQGNWRPSQSIGHPTNTEDNEGAQSFSIDGKYMFFVACDRPDSRGGCDIYYCVHDGAGWSYPINPGEPLNTRYWETTPCLSADGRELFFSSNRPGGKGGKDIWECVVTKRADGTLTFSNPICLSDSINTKDDEFSPFFHQDGETLYFSSNGHKGMGGFDIFYAKRNANYVWSKPVNIGYPINTHKDEYGFVVDAQGEKGYYSSDILSGSDKDVYEFDLYAEARPGAMRYFAGLVRERTHKTPIATTLEVSQVTSGDKHLFASAASGAFATYLPANQEYAVNINQKGFMFYSSTIRPADLVNNKAIIELDSIRVGASLILNNISFATNDYSLLPKSTAELDMVYAFLHSQPNITIEIVGHTDNVGTHEHNVRLSQLRAAEVASYLVRKGVSAERIHCIGRGETEPIASNDTEEGRSQNRRTELRIKEIR